MEYDFDDVIGIGKLDLYYEAHCAGFDGECFSFSIYFQEGLTDEKFQETNTAMDEFIKPYSDKDIYLGYIDVSKFEDNVLIYLDLGDVSPSNGNVAISGVLKSLNNVSGIKSVIINENSEY